MTENQGFTPYVLPASVEELEALVLWLAQSLEHNSSNYNRKMFYGLREVRMSVPAWLKAAFDQSIKDAV